MPGPGAIARGSALGLMLGTGLAMTPAPLAARDKPTQQEPQVQTLPSDPDDFRCFVLLQDRRDRFLDDSGSASQSAELIANLTAISAFYAGRLTHYRADEAQARFSAALQELQALDDAQSDAAAQGCANFYLQVMTYLGRARSQAEQ